MYAGRPRAIAAAVVFAFAAVGLSGCGSSSDRSRHHRDGAPTVQVPHGATLSADAPPSLGQGTSFPLGSTRQVDASGARLSVTLRRVIDPLRGSGARLPGGTRAVAMLVQISSAGPKLYDSSATGDFKLVASSGLVTPVLATRGICKTPLDDFDRYITAGEDRRGCVVFAVANGATLDAVWFSPHAHRLGRLTWAP